MKDWFAKNLGDAMLAQEPLRQLEELLSSSNVSADSPDNMAVFVRHESAGRLHCELIVYFSPAAAVVAQAVNALPCAKPAVNDLGMLAGSRESWVRLFPEHNRE